MSNETMTWQEVCRELLRLDAEGVEEPCQEFEWRGHSDGRWHSTSKHDVETWGESFALANLFSAMREGMPVRLKPRTIRIGDREVPEPVWEPLKDGEQYYIVSTDAARPVWNRWSDGPLDHAWFRRGLIHRTREAAQQHIDALIAVSGGEV